MNDSTKLCQRAHAIALRGFMILASACGPSLSASVCRAGLGETGEEIRERYGEPAAEFDRDFEGTTEKAKEMVFDRSGMVVIVQLHQGKSVEERVLFSGKDGPVTITEQHLQAIEAFLATNTNGPAWKRVPYRTADVMRYSWARQDDKALAWVSSERPFLLRVLDATSIVNKRDAAATQESNASEVAAASPQQASPDYTKSRRWFSRSGKMLGAGVFAGIEDGEVRIRLEDGTVGRIRADKLSDADQLFSKQAKLALEEAEELVLEVPRTPPAARINGGNVPQRDEPDGETTRSAWTGLQEALLIMEDYWGKEKLSEGITKVVFAVSRIPLRNVDPDLRSLIEKHVATHQRSAAVCKEHEQTLVAWEAKWRVKANELQAQSAAAGEAGQALGLFGGVMLEAERKNEWDAINNRFEGPREKAQGEWAALMNEGKKLAEVLEKRYSLPFVKPAP